MKVLGLFSGIGGFELGLQRAGFEVSALCENEEFCVKVLDKNFEGVQTYGDINELTVEEELYDVMCGGFPCTEISIGGKGGGIGGANSSLWKQYKRLIKQGKPKYAIIENVSAICSRGLEVVLQDLAEIGYDATWTMYDTKYFGLPQRRRRIYIVGVRDGIPADADLFQLGQRDSREHRQEVHSIDKSFEWDFTQEQGVGYPFAYFTRQRSDQFAECGVASTLMKRDYKDFTDVVVEPDPLRIRKLTPQERLLLQGFPVDWLDGLGLSNTLKYQCSGMSVSVVQYIGQLVKEFDRKYSNA